MSITLSQFLHLHAAKDKQNTHTRIPDRDKGISSGSYYIDDEELGVFFQTYYNHVFSPANPQAEYLTEKQRETGPLVIDLDFRYRENRRSYTTAHIETFISMTLEEIQRLFTELPGDIEIYVMEKAHVNTTIPDKIKDGLHLFFGINLDKTVKEMLRIRLLSRMDNIWDDIKGNLTNEWTDVIDKGVMLTTTGWQLYGSRKPGHEAYAITAHYTGCIMDGAPLITKGPPIIVTSTFLPKVSVRYQEYRTIDNLRDIYIEEYDNIRSGSVRSRLNVRVVDRTSTTTHEDFTTEEKVDQALARLFDGLGVSKNYVKEAHEFALVLPVSYFGANSYDKWMKVGWALKNTDERLFPSWVKFSSQSSTFSYTDVPDMYNKWLSWEDLQDKSLTSRSLAYWARKDNLLGYNQVIRGSVDSLVNEIIKSNSATEYDMALLLYTMYKDQYVCTSIKNRTWYAFVNHRWVETDTGSNLRMELSQGIFNLFLKKLTETMLCSPQEKEAQEMQKKRVNKISNIMTDLKNHTKKTNIMKEAADHFYVKRFVEQLDSKPYLLGCDNGIIDFQDPALFRQGKPDDFVSRSTRIDYVPITEEHEEIVAEIKEFMHRLFPEKELEEYMWDHMASLLIGKNVNQTFNMYTGVGRNGKSVYVDLLSQVLGEYKATIPVSIITQKRVGVGASSSEIAQLMGMRYAVMQEPSKGDKLNEGVMKELTGGDDLQARQLFKESVTFAVLFKLVICCNELIEIKSNDEGTWRRIRVCPFKSLFCENPVENDPYKPYQFLVDKNVHEKFKKWRTVLLAMLVDRAREKQGAVQDCSIVLEASNEYRGQQDLFAEFIKAHVLRDEHGQIKQTDLQDVFISWWKRSHASNEKVPTKDLFSYMIRHHWGEKVAPPGVAAYWKKIKLVEMVEETPPEQSSV